ncbi:centrosomal protein CEP57L1 isoform X1 [Acanthochromis polyacanthus]|uniref:centrosomal protein CEP57L1 isoform X1 n=1 Tax=Acanthochromis polyacanthus TaxID=80966 RepID=UPI000B8FAA7D|nr:centrosomal protein CEP57L1 isoform X1 [Acanthochromis polyacanthus]
METHLDQILDSPSKNSYIGSYYQPPDRLQPVSRQLELPEESSVRVDPWLASSQVPQTKRNIDSKAVVDALKTLQEKIRRLELERKEAEKSYHQFSHEAQKHQQVTALHSQTSASQSETDNSARKDMDAKLQSAEARCKVLEKQLDYMRKMVENAKKERSALMENQASLQSQQPSNSNNQTQREKLEKLESECLKLSRTQTLAEMKLAILEQKLLKEEHERKLVQEKADELQRELDVNLRLSVPTTEDTKAKKKTKKTVTKTSKQTEVALSSPRRQRMPFVAGTSTSPSHSVHANVQTILHMMKHHQPQLCERVSALHRTGSGAKKSLQKDFPSSSAALHQPDSLPPDQLLSSLSDLLLGLQDELGQMSLYIVFLCCCFFVDFLQAVINLCVCLFVSEHQELVCQIDAVQHQERKRELQSELQRLHTRMEEKGAQITKLRKHQQMVQKMAQSQSCAKEHTAQKLSGIKPPAPSPVKAKQKEKKGMTTQNNLQLLRETQKLRNGLKQDDLSWET